jgi:hypothetical protein
MYNHHIHSIQTGKICNMLSNSYSKKEYEVSSSSRVHDSTLEKLIQCTDLVDGTDTIDIDDQHKDAVAFFNIYEPEITKEALDRPYLSSGYLSRSVIKFNAEKLEAMNTALELLNEFIKLH